MGISLGGRCKSNPYSVPDSNPNPKNFTLIREQLFGEYLVLHVKYPNCTNFEGEKLMVYQGFKDSKELLRFNLGKLDPHFARTKGSPIARFKPVQESIELIEKMAGIE